MEDKVITEDVLIEIVKGFQYTATKAEPRWWVREYMKIAEAGYKAGIREVVEFIEANYPIGTPKWQAFLKERGIDNE